MPFVPLSRGSVIQVVTQIITGSLLTENQIRSISNSIFGSLVADWLPSVKEYKEPQKEPPNPHLEQLEKVVRKAVREEAERGKHIRRLVSFTIWLITLILGAALGTYFDSIVKYVQRWVG